MAIKTAKTPVSNNNSNFKRADRFLNLSVPTASGEKRSIGRIALHVDGKQAEQALIAHLDGDNGEGLNTSQNYSEEVSQSLIQRVLGKLIIDYKDGTAVEEDFTF